MKFSKFLSPLVLAAVVFGLAVPMASAANFTEPKVAKIYAKIVLATDKKVAKIRSVSMEDRAKISAARTNLEKAFVAVDAAFKKPEDRQRAVKQLVRAYSDLNVLIAAVAKVPATVSAPAAAEPVQTVVPAASQSAVSSLSTEAQILYYSDDFENSGTSGGDRFNQSAYSAARCAVDLGRLIQVANGSKSVVVKVNDRPSCSKHPDIVDLTTTAFQSLAPLSKGRISGSFEVLGWSPSGYRKEAISTAGFSDLGVKFDTNIPNTYLPGETLRISGIVTDGKEDTVLFLKSPSGKKYSRSLPVDGNVFSYEIPLLEVGKYDLVVASGMGFSTNKTQPIYVLSDDALVGRKILSSAPVSMNVGEFHFVRKESSDLTPLNVLDLPSIGKKALRTVKISQVGKSDLVRRSMGDVAFYPEDAERFDTAKPVHVTVTAAESSTDFSMDVFGVETVVFDGDLPLVSAYATERKEAVNAFVEGSTLKIRTDLASNGPTLRADTYLIAPNGSVSTHRFAAADLDSNGFVARGRKVELDVPLSDAGQYLVEIMYSNGFPAFNGPVVHKEGVVALMPNEYDSVTKETDSNLDDVVPNALRFINAIRKKVGKAALASDDTLRELAQFKANDMASHNYVGHDDSTGQKITGTAKRAGIQVYGSVGENVAGGSVGTDFLLAGLSLSGGHRSNMLGDWSKVGVAAVVKNGQTYYVQVFGE